MAGRELIFYDENGAAYQPVKHHNQASGRSAFRVKPVGASNKTAEFLELDSIEEVARAMLVQGLPARVKAVDGNGPVSVLRFGAERLVRYELAPDIANRLGVPATSASDGGSSVAAALAQLRQRFLAVYADFENAGAFQATSGSYHQAYRSRVDALLTATAAHTDEGWAVLQDVLTASQSGRGALPPFFDGDVNWRVVRARDADPARFDAALDTLVRSGDDPAVAVAAFNETFRPALDAIGESNTFRDTRVVPATVLAAVAPDRAISVRYTLYSNAERLLNDRTLFANKPITEGEYRAVLALAGQIRAAMTDWGWRPRDLWDVHGFVLATCADRDLADPVLAHFDGNAIFRDARQQWTTEQTAAFRTVATAVHDLGLDWWHVDIEHSPIRFGRKSAGRKKAEGVQGYLTLKPTPRIWFNELGKCVDLGVEHVLFDRDSVDSFAAVLDRHAGAIKAWKPPSSPRPGLWPDQSDEEAASPDATEQPSEQIEHMPTNLILHGPPGTGKTYATAAEAVRLCGEAVPGERAALMTAYRRLADAGRIEFVTFHQSYAYEDFVEGLRPTTAAGDEESEGGSASGGFRLQPVHGVFRRIAALAEQARRRPAGGVGFSLGDRQVFKMSLGRAGAEDHVYDAAIRGSYATLGWGGDVDWSGPEFDGKTGWQAIFNRWRKVEPEASGYSGHVVQTWRFRTSMREGDLVVVSQGNSKFRAIGEITGPYRFDLAGEPGFNHYRDVRWLLVLDEPLPVELIYNKGFSQASCYLLGRAHLKREALERLVPGDAPAAGGAPEQFVLVVDEINRGNISKVFGELITLLEPDKRLGMPNELTVRLPYSGDRFGVPANLHLVGTMNTADRSIALIDKALRRRFIFREMMPDPDLPELKAAGDSAGVDLGVFLRTINNRIEWLLDREHQVGHAWLLGCGTRAKLDAAMRERLIPLIAEYFLEDWGRVADVLGGRAGNPFLERVALTPPPGLAGEEPRYRWLVRPEFAADAYARAVASG